MSQQDHELTPAEKQKQRRGRILGALIFAIVLSPMVIAYWMYTTGIGMPTDTVNKGDLLTTPQTASDLNLRETDGKPWNVADHKTKWRWLIPGGAQCSEQCQKNLYLTRQAHIRLAEKAGRVERIYLLLDDELTPETEEFVANEHPHMPVVRVDADHLRTAFTAAGIEGDVLTDGRYFLMDQEGFVMMSYTPAHTGKELLDDIKRMLKYSYED